MENERNPYLAVDHLTVEYTSDGEVIHAVNDVSFQLEKGRSLGLVGETGAGKTTIAKAILRILPSPQAKVCSGEINLEGQNILLHSEAEMREIRGQKISMIFQDPMTALNPTMKIGEQVAEVVRLHSNVTNAQAKERALEMLGRVGIMPDRYDDYPFQFSGGMKQRVVIAMALVFRPELLLADEPTTALDVTIQAQILDIIRHFKEKFHTSMILITHDLGIVAENCDDVAVIYAGQIVEYGSLEDVFDHPSHPYTVGLFHSLPEFSVGEARLHPILGSPPDPREIAEGCPFYPRCSRAKEDCIGSVLQGEERPVSVEETAQGAGIPEVEISPGHRCRCLHPEV